MLTALACGRPYLPLDTGFPEERNAQIVAHAGPGVVVTDLATAAAARAMAPSLPLVLVDDLPPAGRPLEVTATADDPAYILYTSGSTGRPKGVVQNQRGLLHDVMQYVNSVHLDAGDRLTQLYSPSVNGAIRDVYGALLTGGTLYPVDLRREGLRRLRGLLLDGTITVLHAMPPVFRAVHEALGQEPCPPAVRLVYLAGDRIFTSDVARFRQATAPGTLLYVGIGSTENATIYRQWFLGHRTPVDSHLLPVGHPVPDRPSALLAEDGTPVRPGETGEIVVTSRYMALGYWNEPTLTATAFRPSHADPAARVFRTGDLGRLRADGLLEFAGRRDRQLKIRGYRVEPAETEAVLRATPGVADAVVIGRTDEAGGGRLVAFAAPSAGATLDPALLTARLAAHLPAHQRPEAIHVLPGLPTLPNLKHDLAALERLDTGPAKQSAAVPPGPEEDATMAAVRAAWQEILGAGSFAQAGTFVEAGGDSLELLRFVLALEERLGAPVPADALSLEMRPLNLVARLASRKPLAPTRHPRLFIVPSADGGAVHDLRLVGLLRPAIRAEILPLPSLDAEWRDLPSIDDLAKACAARMAARAPAGPVALLVHPHRTPCASWFPVRSGRDASAHLRPQAER
jgi:amino acid adenylation domain-containing protein